MDDVNMLASILNAENEYFRQLKPPIRKDACRCISIRTLEEGEYIFKQGDLGTEFFIVHKGLLAIIVDNKTVSNFEPGQGLGELALIDKEKQRRNASCMAQVPTELIVVPKDDYCRIFMSSDAAEISEKREFLEKHPDFCSLPPSQMAGLASQASLKVVAVNQAIVKEGAPSDRVYFIMAGTARATVKRKGKLHEGRVVKYGEGVGTDECKRDIPYQSSVYPAGEPVTTLSFLKEEYVTVDNYSRDLMHQVRTARPPPPPQLLLLFALLD